MSNRRATAYAVCGLLIGGLLVAPAVAASSHPAAQLTADRTIGRVAYVTHGQQINIATVQANGSVSSSQTVGPVTPAKSGQTIQIFDLTASDDGRWLAWQELAETDHGTHVTTVLAIRNVVTAVTWHLTTEQYPVGFAADQLLTSDGIGVRRVKVGSTLHLLKIPDHRAQALSAYPHGLIDLTSSDAPTGPARSDRLRLTTLSGAHTVLHTYRLAPTDYRDPDGAWTSSDGKRLVIERGNHQDFDGLGPSSLADEFALTGSHRRTALGHYGTAAAKWRIAAVSFAGPSDVVWAVWERATGSGARSVVATFHAGAWRKIATSAIAVAGNSAGYVVVQVGKWVSVGTDFPEFQTVPTAEALLLHGGQPVPLSVEGTEFAWVAGA
jgi:hypothetical protein